MSLSARKISVDYDVPASRDDWTLSEETMPESHPHELTVELIKLILVAWVARMGLDAQVVRNLAVRWNEVRPQIGVDPDVALISPRTPEGVEVMSICLWREGHTAPRVAVEVVSTTNPNKDYNIVPDKYAASGTGELWVFDPKLAGPKANGGPFRIQLWQRNGEGVFARSYAGEGPVWSPAVGGWLFAVNEGERLRIADDEAGTAWWTTGEETERAGREAERAAKEAALAAEEAERLAKEAALAAVEAERAAKEAERAGKESALARVAELEAELARRGG